MDGIITAPVKKEIVVACPIERAFAVFTDGIASWWPLPTHSIYGEAATDVVFEAGVGGQIYEVNATGERGWWGEVQVWEPPHRVVYSWNPNPNRVETTEIEVRFAVEGDGTRVSLEHRGWERLGDSAGELRASYQTGWDPVLLAFAEAARG